MKSSSSRPIRRSFSREQQRSTGSSFYTQNTGERPLDAPPIEQPSVERERFTSRHKPPRRRENNNRAGAYAISLLFVRTFLVIAAIGGGIIALKIYTNHLQNPTEEQKRIWDEQNRQPWKISSKHSAATTGVPDNLSRIDLLIKEQIEQWKIADRNLRAAKEALHRPGFETEALARLQQVLQATPENHEAQQLMFDFLMRKGAFADAVPYAMRLIDQNSSDLNMQIRLLQALYRGDYADAAGALAEYLLIIRPDNDQVLEIAAMLNVEANNLDSALEHYLRILSVNRHNEAALRGVSAIFSSRGEWEKAVPYYIELTRVAPDETTYHWLAVCFSQMDEMEKAVTLLGQSASLYGENTVAGWLPNPGFDTIRETEDFRNFADHIAGSERRRAIEALRRSERRGELDEQFQIKIVKPKGLW